jgi:hypothetical protein
MPSPFNGRCCGGEYEHGRFHLLPIVSDILLSKLLRLAVSDPRLDNMEPRQAIEVFESLSKMFWIRKGFDRARLLRCVWVFPSHVICILKRHQ